MKQADKIAKDRYLKQLELVRSSTTVNPFEDDETKQNRIKRAKKDVAFMVEYYFPHYATAKSADFQIEWAVKVKRDKTFKGFAQWGRGLAKSVWNNILIPFWLFINDEPIYFVIIGNSYNKAKQLLSDLQAEFEANPRIIADFGEQKLLGSWEDGNFQTQGGFIGHALGMGQSVRGLRKKSLRPNLINCDDIEDKQIAKNPRRQREMVKWIERDLIPTMDGDYRRFTYSNNRFAPVMIQTILQEKHPKWLVHEVKAYDAVTYKPAWNSKYSDTYYRDLEAELGSLATKSEYNNEPHVEGIIFKEEQIQWCKLPRIDHFEHIVGHWDIAYAGTATADYNAVRIWGLKDKQFYLIDCFVKQTKMKKAVEFICDFQRNLSTNAFVHWQFEAQFWNDEVERTINETLDAFGMDIPISKVHTTKVNKFDRILSLQAYYQNGRIWYNEKLKAHNDTNVGLAQLYAIEPNYNSHDDAPDTDQQAISYLSQFSRYAKTAKPKVGHYKSKNRY